MKILIIESQYHDYLKYFYKKNRISKSSKYLDELNKITNDGFGFTFWPFYLRNMGIETEIIIPQNHILQKLWIEENLSNSKKNIGMEEIVLEQVRMIKPDILIYNYHDFKLLKEIKEKNRNIKQCIGWSGSAINVSSDWKELDIVFSCAPETVSILNDYGVNSVHLNHSFDPNINKKMSKNKIKYEISFFGQIVRGEQYHNERERILVELCKKSNVAIFSPSSNISYMDYSKYLLKYLIYNTCDGLSNIGIKKFPILNKKRFLKPINPINNNLKKFLRKPTYGLDMFQMIKDSLLVLNVHADSSPHYASNMRLYETTGVGTCLITDWKPNIKELFEPDIEVVTYKTVDDCLDKIKWLLNNPNEIKKIAEAGKKRTLVEHSSEIRIKTFVEIIKKNLK